MSFDLKLTKGDLQLQGGELNTVQNQEKLIQDALKILFTSTGENSVHPWYGTPLLSRSVGQSAISEIVQAEISDAVNFGLNNLKTLQQLQERDNQFVTPQEMIASLDEVSAVLSEIDKRKLVVNIKMKARSSELVSESFVIRV